MKLNKEQKKHLKEIAKLYDVSKEEMLETVVFYGLKYMERKAEKKRLDETDLKDLGLTEIVVDALYANFFFKVRDVVNLDFESIPGISPSSARIIKERIDELYTERK